MPAPRPQQTPQRFIADALTFLVTAGWVVVVCMAVRLLFTQGG